MQKVFCKVCLMFAQLFDKLVKTKVDLAIINCLGKVCFRGKLFAGLVALTLL